MGIYVAAAVAFLCGMVAMFNFMRTAYAYPDISRWFYAGDAVFACWWLGVALWITSEAIKQ